MSDITPREEVWAVVWQESQITWTTEDIKKSIQSEISEDTIRSALNNMTEEGFLNHKFSSNCWYVHPEFL